MALSVPLPKSMQSELGGNTHPGLALDKYVASWEEGGQAGKLSEKVQKPAIDAVVGLSRAEPPGCNLESLRARRAAALAVLGAELFRCQMTGPLTLHLARASALENAGICLHPIYGFTYFPGSGLKGMARAFAETVWLPGQFKAAANGQPDGPEEENKARKAWDNIERVFGWAPSSDTLEGGKPKPWKPQCVPKRGENDSAHSGSIVFRDAWPEEWPKLFMDIVNNHHPDYYLGKDDKDAPGDWENPIPVYFLAVPPGQTFSFALSKRRNDVDNSKGGRDARAPGLIDLAKEWLLGALCHLGAGAKTAAGYGCFKPVDGALPTLKSPARETFQTTLELVTPAFLAGAKQEREDCDLRPATLRGLLRWWWRTMHAGWVDVATLRKLEAAVWGDTNSGGAVRLTLEPESPLDPQQYDYKDRFRPKAEFKQQHELENSPNSKTTQGLFYLSYGMDEISHGVARHRWYKDPGARWRIALSARGTVYEDRNARGEVTRKVRVGAPQVLAQARAALWLLCQFGGVGSKARKGFGSLSDFEGLTLEEYNKAGREFREACGVRQHQREPDSPALEKMLPTLVIPTPWKDAWFALDQVGFSAQAFAQKFAHNPDKVALGLPRKIHGPRSAPLTSQNNKSWKPEKWLGDLHPKLGSRKRKEKDMRDASPVHYHLAKAPDGTLTIRVTAFPAKYLPDTEASRKFLSKLLGHLKTDLEKRAKDLAGKGQQKAPSRVVASARVSPPAPAGRGLPKAGDLVEAVLVEDPKAKGRRFAKHVASGKVGSIQNPGDIPPDKKTGDQVRLIVAIWTTDQVQFKWPKPVDSEKPGKAKPRSGPGAGTRR